MEVFLAHLAMVHTIYTSVYVYVCVCLSICGVVLADQGSGILSLFVETKSVPFPINLS